MFARSQHAIHPWQTQYSVPSKYEITSTAGTRSRTQRRSIWAKWRYLVRRADICTNHIMFHVVFFYFLKEGVSPPLLVSHNCCTKCLALFISTDIKISVIYISYWLFDLFANILMQRQLHSFETRRILFYFDSYNHWHKGHDYQHHLHYTSSGWRGLGGCRLCTLHLMSHLHCLRIASVMIGLTYQTL